MSNSESQTNCGSSHGSLGDENKKQFWDYGKYTVEGWMQAGDISGLSFGSWSKQLPDGLTMGIQIGDSSGRYWLRVGNCYHGSHLAPDSAAELAEEILRERVV